MKRTLRILSLALALLLTANLLWASPAMADDTNSPFKSVSVTLHEALQLNFTVEVANIETAVMTFQAGGITQTVKGTEAKPKDADKNLYVFPCRITAVQMTDTVTATLTDNGQTYKKETSVRDYAEKLLSKKQEWDFLVANPMMLATLHYGAALQDYANYNEENPANKDYDAPDAPASIPENKAYVDGSVTGVTALSASLILKDSVTVRYYITLDGDLSDYSFTVNGNSVTPTSIDGRFFVDFNDINPQEYEEEVSLAISKDGNAMTITYSPLCYIYAKYNNDSTKASLKTLAGRMYQYYTAAETYSANPKGNDNDNVVNAQSAN